MQSEPITTNVVSSNTLRRGVLDTTLCDKVCQWIAAGRWFSPGTTVSSTNKTDRHDIDEILLKVALNTITLTHNTPYEKKILKHSFLFCFGRWIHLGVVMMIVLSMGSVVDRWFDFRAGNIIYYKTDMCIFSNKHAAWRRKNKIGWLWVRIMCPCWATWLHVDCCVSDATCRLLCQWYYM